MNRRSRLHRRGYVLLVALALTALAAVVAVGLSRLAVRRIVHARMAVDELQLRWGTSSCRQALLPYAEQLILAADADDGAGSAQPVSIVRETVPLGSLEFDLTIADEQAKANANALLRTRSDGRAEQAVRTLVKGRGRPVAVRLRGQPGNPWPIGSYAQLFADAGPEELTATRSAAGGTAAVDAVTCWGSGQLNVARAPDDVMTEVLAPLMTRLQVREIIDARERLRRERQHGADEVGGVIADDGDTSGDPARDPFTVDDALAAARIPPDEQDAARALMTSRSSCWSLWVAARSEQLTWHALWVRERLRARELRVTSFEW